jgi:exonuclease VII small subunit
METGPHQHLVDALERLIEELQHQDAPTTAASSTEALALFRATPSPAEDPRVIPLFQRALALAEERQRTLQQNLREVATSSRAATAYGSGRR